MVKPIQLMIVGAQKAGTSSLLRYLAQHPEIVTHSQPEMTFFLQEREYSRGYEWAFTKYFAKPLIEKGKSGSQGDAADDNKAENKDKRLIAKNVMVMHSSDIMERIYAHNPMITLVVLLREPVARAYSAYWWARRSGWETLKTFEEAIAAEEARLKEGWFKWRQCAYRHNSVYYPHVQNLINKFGVTRLHFVFTEDLKENAQAVCQRLFNQLSIHADFEPVIVHQHNRAAMPRSERFNFLFTQFLASHNPMRRAIRKLVPDATAYKLRKAILNWNDKPWTAPPIAPETRAELGAYFQPFNRKLAELLGQELTQWNH